MRVGCNSASVAWLEDSQVNLQSRLEQEEEAKAALLSRIERLTKLILVSTKTAQSSRFPHRPGPSRRHSFGEEELAYLPIRKRDLILDDKNIDIYTSLDGNSEAAGADETFKEQKKTRKNGLLNWIKPQKRDDGSGTFRSTSDKSSGTKSMSTPSTPKAESGNLLMESRLSSSMPTENTSFDDLLSEVRHERETLEDFLQHGTPLSVAELETRLNEKSFELEVKALDNRIIQEQLNQKINECEKLHQTVLSLKEQLSEAHEFNNLSQVIGNSKRYTESDNITVPKDKHEGSVLKAQMEIRELTEKVTELTESREKLEVQNQKLAEESSYAKELASAAAVELKALSEEVAKLMNHNERLVAELAAQKSPQTQRRTIAANRNGGRDVNIERHGQGTINTEIKRELDIFREREHSYEAALAEKDQREAELQRRVEESKQKETYLENELANMWVLVAKLKKSQGAEINTSELTREGPITNDDCEILNGTNQTKNFQ